MSKEDIDKEDQAIDRARERDLANQERETQRELAEVNKVRAKQGLAPWTYADTRRSEW